MVKKKAKVPKSAKKREIWQMEDVQVHTGLPPQVEGQLRCFCRMTIGQILWLSPSPPDVTHVRVKWWGEDGDGSIFRPVNANKKSATASKIVARYPVRSGPKQFASYLNDMGSLVVEILTGPSMIPVGHAEIPQIGLLSPARPINGFYPVFTHQEEKVGEIHVSLVLESLMASYDSMGSIPTTDISMETHTTQESMYPQQGRPIPHSQAPTKPEIDPFISPASRQNLNSCFYNNGELKFGERASNLRQQLNYSGHERPERQQSPVRSGSTVAITTNGDVVTTRNIPQSNQAAGSDLLSVLLNKGNKLREEMVLSSMNSYGQTSVKEVYHDDVVPVNGVNAADISGMSQSYMYKEILKADQEAGIGGSSVDVSRLDDKAVDLVFGDTGPFDLQMLKMTNGSPGSSISEVDVISEPGDPVHSQSILQELFYKNLDYNSDNSQNV
ncbi:hypothetical protein KUTeg_024556 [Tegillarca granosa]|uniref:C2CD3 N-terminal C2 domain-containing protein n=1 Tax=Tegillarca granosa TaxID=220873 RepID=A0ABQ9DYP9_TEGGR|nr:hypothetical protein KUTeg_024556 [Tegillarca granosa]